MDEGVLASETAAKKPRAATTRIKPDGPYTRTLMTIVVGLLESDSEEDGKAQPKPAAPAHGSAAAPRGGAAASSRKRPKFL